MKLEEFNKKFTGILHVRMNKLPERIAPGTNLMNERAAEDATIKSIDFQSQVYEGGEFREPSRDELDSVLVERPEIRLKSYGEEIVHKARNGKHFTVREIIDAILVTEKATRGQSEWFGGPDIHHIYFEGIHPQPDGTFRVYWGS
jgi:hypothetical protein